MLSFGFGRVAQNAYKTLDDRTKKALVAYAAGINDYVEKLAILPVEFLILNAGFEKWEISDSLLIGMYVGFQLSPHWAVNILRSSIAKLYGNEFAAKIICIGDKYSALEKSYTIITEEQLKKHGVFEAEAMIKQPAQEPVPTKEALKPSAPNTSTQEAHKEKPSVIVTEEIQKLRGATKPAATTTDATKESAKSNMAPPKVNVIPKESVPSEKLAPSAKPVPSKEPAHSAKESDKPVPSTKEPVPSAKESASSAKESAKTAPSTKSASSSAEQQATANKSNDAPNADLNLDVKIGAGASNSWAVSGAHTASGKPLIAGDPHMASTQPGILYAATMRFINTNSKVSGFTIAGIPLMVFGRTNYAAWAVTSSYVENADVYELKLDMKSKKYFHDNRWKDLTIHKHVISVKGKNQVPYETYETHHGAVLFPPDKTVAASFPEPYH